MAEVKWIKIVTDVFDDEKIILIDALPERDAILVIWFKMLCLAGKQNNGGVLMLNDKIAYTDEMLSTIFRRPINTVRLALQTFENFGMIEIVNNTIMIPNWNKHQTLDALEKSREKTRKRVAKHREKQRLIASNGVTICQYCGEPATGFDHIVATARGGKDTDENKVPCCIRCNRIKNDKPLVDFLNSNRDIINDEIILSNDKLLNFVTLCNVTDRYNETLRNADRVEEEKEEEREREKEAEAEVKGAGAPYVYYDVDDEKDNKLDFFKGRVMLTENQTADLLEKMDLYVFDEYIDRLDKFITDNNANIKSHYKTILKWYNEDCGVNS